MSAVQMWQAVIGAEKGEPSEARSVLEGVVGSLKEAAGAGGMAGASVQPMLDVAHVLLAPSLFHRFWIYEQSTPFPTPRSSYPTGSVLLSLHQVNSSDSSLPLAARRSLLSVSSPSSSLFPHLHLLLSSADFLAASRSAAPRKRAAHLHQEWAAWPSACRPARVLAALGEALAGLEAVAGAPEKGTSEKGASAAGIGEGRAGAGGGGGRGGAGRGGGGGEGGGRGAAGGKDGAAGQGGGGRGGELKEKSEGGAERGREGSGGGCGGRSPLGLVQAAVHVDPSCGRHWEVLRRLRSQGRAGDAAPAGTPSLVRELWVHSLLSASECAARCCSPPTSTLDRSQPPLSLASLSLSLASHALSECLLLPDSSPSANQKAALRACAECQVARCHSLQQPATDSRTPPPVTPSFPASLLPSLASASSLFSSGFCQEAEAVVAALQAQGLQGQGETKLLLMSAVQMWQAVIGAEKGEPSEARSVLEGVVGSLKEAAGAGGMAGASVQPMLDVAHVLLAPSLFHRFWIYEQSTPFPTPRSSYPTGSVLLSLHQVNSSDSSLPLAARRSLLSVSSPSSSLFPHLHLLLSSADFLAASRSAAPRKRAAHLHQEWAAWPSACRPARVLAALGEALAGLEAVAGAPEKGTSEKGASAAGIGEGRAGAGGGGGRGGAGRGGGGGEGGGRGAAGGKDGAAGQGGGGRGGELKEKSEGGAERGREGSGGGCGGRSPLGLVQAAVHVDPSCGRHWEVLRRLRSQGRAGDAVRS
ncbi:unnamed protein product [Closterium sp. NIES-54]